MSDTTASPPLWRKVLAAYQQPHHGRSVLELILCAAPLAAIWAGAWVAVTFGLWWLGLILAVPAAGFLVRLFMVQHDCSHMAFFRAPAANHWTGRILGVLTLTPHDCWRRSHAIHHATAGNLDRRGLGDIKTLTIEEYRALTPVQRFGYRLFRHPLILFGVGPTYLFLIEQRLPMGFMRDGWRPWLSAMGTNLAIAAAVLGVVLLGGWKGLLLIHLPTLALAATIGVWLFFVQHQFEETYWARGDDWDQTEAAFKGSSHLVLPGVLRWMTANIGLHHVHHVSSRIPFYRLPKVLKDHPELVDVSRIGFLESLRSARLALWDEARGRLVSFREAKRLAPA